MINFDDFLMSPIVTKGLLTLISLMGSYLIVNLKRILKTIRYMELKQIAMDYALEKSSKNGYADYRDEKMKELTSRDKFIGKVI